MLEDTIGLGYKRMRKHLLYSEVREIDLVHSVIELRTVDRWICWRSNFRDRLLNGRLIRQVTASRASSSGS